MMLFFSKKIFEKKLELLLNYKIDEKFYFIGDARR